MATVSIYGVTCTVNAVTTLVTSALLSTPCAVVFDAAGNLYTGQAGNNDVNILPAATATVFGVACTINTLETLLSSGLDLPQGLCFDTAGNLYIGNSTGANVKVLPKASGTIFGHTVVANTLYTLASSVTALEVVNIDATGNIWVLYSTGTKLGVIPVSTGTLFGVSVTANTFTTILSTGITQGIDLCIDAAGNVYIADYSANVVWVLPVATAPIFGVSCTINTLTSLGTFAHANGICMDAAGNLYVSCTTDLKVISKTTTTLYGVACTANVITILIATTRGHLGIDSAGNIYIGGSGALLVLAAAAWPPVPSYTGAASQAVAFATSASVPVSSAFLSFFP